MRIALAVAIAVLCVVVMSVGVVPHATRADPADWTQITPPEGFRWGSFWSVDMVNGGFGVVAGSQGLIEYHSGVFVPVTPTLYLRRSPMGVDMVSEDNGWAVGNAGLLLHYYDETWHLVASPTEQSLERVAMVSVSDGWAIGGAGDVIHWDGSSWSLYQTLDDRLSDVSMVATDDGWIAGQKCFYRYVEEYWQCSQEVDGDILRLRMLSETDGWAILDNAVWRYYEGSWRQWSMLADWDWNTPTAIDMLTDADGWMAANNGAVYHYDGSSWQLVAQVAPADPSGGSYPCLYDIDMISHWDGWVVGYDTTLVHYVSLEGCVDLVCDGRRLFLPLLGWVVPASARGVADPVAARDTRRR
jgi:hypothetical protein